MRGVVFLLILTFVVTSVTSEDPRVHIAQGLLRGTYMWSREGRQFYAFQGIPYAAPPVGDLRFKAPSKAPIWKGELDAQKEGNACLQMHILFNTFRGDEDCLYVNVYTPQLEGEGTPLNVMVFIHGGGFLIHDGGTEFYGPHFLLDRDIVLVTINYRLGALGFLSLETKEAPGNYGLKDQMAALRWVQKNIAKFGGNPNSVTIFGQSAGAASVHYLMLSPQAKGLFHRAILQSGCALNPWALTTNARSSALELVASLGCSSDVDPMTCLRSASAHDLVQLSSLMYLNTLRAEYKDRNSFAPTIEPADSDQPILTEHPRDSMSRGAIVDVPVMAGLNTHEGILHLFVLRNWTAIQDYRTNFARFLPTEVPRGTKKALVISEEIGQFYTDLTGGDFLQQYIKLNSDVDFVLGVDDFVREMASFHRQPVYYYQFSYSGGLGLLKNLKFPSLVGTAHGDEIGYMFSQQFWQTVPWAFFWPPDTTTIERITTLWTNFASTGNPTPDDDLGVRWEPVEAVSNEPKMATTRYLDIGLELIMENECMNGDRVEFWWDLHRRCSAQNTTVSNSMTP